MSLDEENKLRIGVHRGGFSVENGMMESRAEMRGRNGVIHPVNKVLRTPRLSAGGYLRKDGRFKYAIKGSSCLQINIVQYRISPLLYRNFEVARKSLCATFLVK